MQRRPKCTASMQTPTLTRTGTRTHHRTPICTHAVAHPFVLLAPLLAFPHAATGRASPSGEYALRLPCLRAA
eukprot:4899095-Pleurochrysis_carterae.AAC.3